MIMSVELSKHFWATLSVGFDTKQHKHRDMNQWKRTFASVYSIVSYIAACNELYVILVHAGTFGLVNRKKEKEIESPNAESLENRILLKIFI